MALSVLHRDDLPLGGFAGLREHRLVMGSKVFGGRANPGTWNGIGDFVYLADARFMPRGETHLHDHKEVDVISVIAEGRISHEGTLEHGTELRAYDVQVQRAGAEGFSHNEVNPDDTENRMIQIWVLPEEEGEPADYKVYKLSRGSDMRVYGGRADQDETFASNTVVHVALLDNGQEARSEKPFMSYIVQGKGICNAEVNVADGDLIRGDSLHFKALSQALLIIIHVE